jgi:hypothetical protein
MARGPDDADGHDDPTVLTCTSSDTGATPRGSSGLSGTGIGSITAISFTSCTGPTGLQFAVTGNNLPYSLNARSCSSSTGTTKGKITDIDARLSGAGCSAMPGAGGRFSSGSHPGQSLSRKLLFYQMRPDRTL